MNHLETLVGEFLEWNGYLLRRNTKVGRLPHGGWSMELDVVGYHPHTHHLVHYEPSIDARPWAEREERFRAKFDRGREYIFTEMFTWLPDDLPIEQIALCISHPQGRDTIGGGTLKSIDEFVRDVRQAIREQGVVAKNAIPEGYPLLRTLQLAENGYYKSLPMTGSV